MILFLSVSNQLDTGGGIDIQCMVFQGLLCFIAIAALGDVERIG